MAQHGTRCVPRSCAHREGHSKVARFAAYPRCSTDVRSAERGPRVKRPILVVGLAALIPTIGGWVVVNPAGQFGVSRFGVTTFNRVPVPYLDLQVRPDGAVRWRWKSHDLNAEALRWLTDSTPEVLIIGVGWESSARVPEDVAGRRDTRVLVLPTEQALSTFNSLRQRKVRVAIHVHSTC